MIELISPLYFAKPLQNRLAVKGEELFFCGFNEMDIFARHKCRAEGGSRNI